MAAQNTYFIVWKGRRDGPYSLEELTDLLERGEIGLLHRVETSAGLVPLRQLLLEVDPARWGELAEAPSPLGHLPTPAKPVPTADAAPLPGMAPTAPAGETLAEDVAQRAYMTCGLCFALPPLAFRALAMARKLAAEGYPQTAERLKVLSLGLSAGGVCFWLLLIWLLFSRR